MQSVVSFYSFQKIKAPEEATQAITTVGKEVGALGTVLVAREGINGSLVHALPATLERILDVIRSFVPLNELDVKWSTARDDFRVFYRLKVREKKEIVNFGFELTNHMIRGKHIDPHNWNDLLDDSNVVLLDVRNNYETEIGGFEGATTLDTGTFRDLPKLYERGYLVKDQPVAMYCTGGIRCEKASHWLLKQGHSQVYQLHGGILNYLDNVEADQSKWRGECFVFDQRVSVDTNLDQGSYDQCHACRRPITTADKSSDLYERGISCPRCYHETSADQKASYAERMRQVELASARGVHHLG